ncbi:MAG: tRNA pseudouridine(55) synthase TruB [Dethiobacter sp.]|jgi:tRNA pseudouridine55 synthase|nr:tRNA pseudouridine(55) synthase TruB [Dethiobacter sp.]
MAMDGILNILKPPGMTSHDVVSCIRRLTGIKQCGHTGTLDPGAAGILPVCVGNATRVSEYVLEMDKTYRAQLSLGSATDTEDASGRVISKMEIPPLNESDISHILQQFVGRTSQVPPMYSAVRRDGVRLYELARRGETVSREPRQITIYRLKLLALAGNKLFFDVVCSRGTYIRTLCTDIAVRLGTCGHMSFLLRTAVGPFVLNNSYTLEEIAGLQDDGCLDTAFLPLDTALHQYPSFLATPAQAVSIIHGRAITSGADYPEGLPIRVYSTDGIMLAVAYQSEGMLKPKKVFITG